MRNIILLTFILIGLFTKAQHDELIENTWYLQKIIIDESEYITPINEEVNEVTTHFYSTAFSTGVCNGFVGLIQYHVSEQSFTLSDVSITLMDCALNDNYVFESLYFWQFFYNGSELAQPFNYSIVDYNNYQILTITNSIGVQAIYHTQNTVSISKFDLLNSRLSIYPNPAQDFIMIETSSNIRSVSITNYMGQIVSSTKKVEATQSRVETSSLSAGVYFVEVETEASIETVKIVISR